MSLKNLDLELTWRSFGVVVASFVSLCLSFAPMYVATLPIFMEDICHEFGWSRTAVTAGVSVGFVTGIFAPAVGVLVDRFRPRNVILVSTATFGVTLAAMGFLPGNYALFLGLSFVLGLAGGTGAGPLSYFSLLPRWFDRRLGFSIGMANMGIGMGMMVMPLVAQELVHFHGWRGAYFVLSGMVLCIALPTATLLVWDGPRAKPPQREMGRTSEPAPFALSTKDALATRLFWLLSLTAFLVTSTVAASIVHLFPMLTDRGLSRQAAARIAAVLAALGLLSSLSTGILLDYVAPWVVGLLFYFCVAAGAAFLPHYVGSWGLIGAVTLIGIGSGLEGNLVPYMIRKYFGPTNFGAIYALVGITFSSGIVVGPLIAAQAYDRFGTYTPAFSGLALAALVGALLMVLGVRGAAARLVRERQLRHNRSAAALKPL
jgi:MFS transporter, OFA family, oxalate/formate antiporter